MDGGMGDQGAWRSSIPGVSQREGAPASLGLTARGVGAWREPEGAQSAGEGPMLREGDGSTDGARGRSPGGRRRGGGQPRGQRRRGVVLPWRAMGLAVLALGAVLGVARAAGADGGSSEGAAGWGAERPAASAVAADPVASPEDDALTPEDTASTAIPGAAVPTPTPDASSSAVDAGGAEPDWWTVMAELDANRIRALTAVDPASAADLRRARITGVGG